MRLHPLCFAGYATAVDDTYLYIGSEVRHASLRSDVVNFRPLFRLTCSYGAAFNEPGCTIPSGQCHRLRQRWVGSFGSLFIYLMWPTCGEIVRPITPCEQHYARERGTARKANLNADKEEDVSGTPSLNLTQKSRCLRTTGVEST